MLFQPWKILLFYQITWFNFYIEKLKLLQWTISFGFRRILLWSLLSFTIVFCYSIQWSTSKPLLFTKFWYSLDNINLTLLISLQFRWVLKNRSKNFINPISFLYILYSILYFYTLLYILLLFSILYLNYKFIAYIGFHNLIEYFSNHQPQLYVFYLLIYYTISYTYIQYKYNYIYLLCKYVIFGYIYSYIYWVIFTTPIVIYYNTTLT